MKKYKVTFTPSKAVVKTMSGKPLLESTGLKARALYRKFNGDAEKLVKNTILTESRRPFDRGVVNSTVQKALKETDPESTAYKFFRIGPGVFDLNVIYPNAVTMAGLIEEFVENRNPVDDYISYPIQIQFSYQEGEIYLGYCEIPLNIYLKETGKQGRSGPIFAFDGVEIDNAADYEYEASPSFEKDTKGYGYFAQKDASQSYAHFTYEDAEDTLLYITKFIHERKFMQNIINQKIAKVFKSANR